MSQTLVRDPQTDDLLQLSEAVASAPQRGEDGSVFDEDGNVLIHVIRPGIGRGRGKHLYEADMLQQNAEKFAGWRMYLNHLSPEARKAAGGLPRPVQDLGGRVLESWWDPTVPADDRFDQGAVVGKVRPVNFVRELIESDPEIIEASISATATGVKPVMRGGQKVWLVEGIEDRGSVDWVTEAGAGGRVAPLLESAYETDEQVELALLEAMTDDEVRSYITTHRSITLAEGAGSTNDTDGDHQEADDMTITPEMLAEALATPEAQAAITTIVEARLAEERELIRAEASGDAYRQVQIMKLEGEAQRLIAESGLPEKAREALAERFRIDETTGEPTQALDVVDELDEFGNVTKPATELLREAVSTEIEAQREIVAEVSPTVVTGQGEGSSSDNNGDGSTVEEAKADPKATGWGKYLQEAAGIDPAQAYGITVQGAGE